MIAIYKEKPSELISKLRNAERDGISYDDILFKDYIRRSLFAEQKGICAYCMGRISFDKDSKYFMKIEHWNPQSANGGDVLSYSNMLGCCKGGEGEPYGSQTCDTAKKDKRISYNPSNPDDWSKMQIYYIFSSGEIKSKDEKFNKELNEVLHLNTARLKNCRKDLVNACIMRLSGRKGSRTVGEIDKMIEDLKKLKDGMYTPFFHIGVEYLEKQKKKR